jgi:capsular exopolysaccharide synthesis family protein
MEALEREIHLLDYWRVLVKRRWVVYTSLAVVVSTVAIGSLLMQPVYTATARLQIESSAPNVLPFQEVLSSVPDQRNDFYQTQYGLIQSRRVAREVIDSLRLERHPEFQIRSRPRPAPGLSSEQALEARRIDLLLERLKVTPVRNSRLVDVSFSAHDRALAARVANRMAETYIAFNSEAKYNTSERATASIAHQIANLQEEIDATEQELQAYARRHGIIPLSQNENITVKKLNDLNGSYTRAQAARIEAEARFAALRMAGPEKVAEVRDSKLVQDLTAKLADLTRRHAQLSEKFRPEWPEMVRLQREIDETRERIAGERQALYSQVLGAAESAYRASRNEEAFLRGALEEAKDQSQEQSLKEIQYNNLKAEVANRRATLEALLKRQSETASSAGVNEQAAGNIRVVDVAETPGKPSSPNIPVNLALGVLVGLTLGVGLAFFLDYVDKSIKGADEMEQATGVPVLGVVPALRQAPARLKLVSHQGRGSLKMQVVRVSQDDSEAAPRVELITHENFKSNVSEAFRELRTALLVSRPGGPPRTILVTSTLPGEGKTAVALNLSIALTQIGRRVLLVDADLRRPRLHRLMGVSNQVGLSNDLCGSGMLRARPAATLVPRLDLVPSGPVPPNSADLLDSERFVQMQRAYEHLGYDHVVFDSPPVLAVADPAILATRTEAVLVVVQAGVTSRDALAETMQRLRQVKARVLGGILNQLSFDSQGYYYQYRRYYGEDAAAPGPRVAGTA